MPLEPDKTWHESRSTTRRCATARQGEDVAFTLDDKLRIAERLDELGVDYIEGGWPGSNPKDEEFFARVREAQAEARARSPRSARRGAADVAAEDDLQPAGSC